MRGIPSGEGGDRFPLLPPTKIAGFGGIWAAAALATRLGDALVGRVEEEWGGRGPARAQVFALVAIIVPVSTRTAPASANVSPLSRHMHWCDRGQLSCQL